MSTVRRLVGVYHADGTLRGELAYFVGKRFGRAHCALCDVTHGLVRTRADWQACRATLPVEFVTFHRDDQPDAIRVAAGGSTPVVVAETDDGAVVLLDPAGIEACAPSPERLVEAIHHAVAARDLQWPTLD